MPGTVSLTRPGRTVGATVTGGGLVLGPPVGWVGEDTVGLTFAARSEGDTAIVILVPIAVRPGPFAVDRNPYQEVDWDGPRWKVQLHDHPGVNPVEYRAYDDAGYHALVLMQYSGVATFPYAWTARHWPAESWLPSSLLNGFHNLKLLIPAAEEVGAWHVTSPFLEQWINKWDAGLTPFPRAWEYSTTQEAIDRVNEFGGLAILAHPWLDNQFGGLVRMRGLEMYSAFAQYRAEEGSDPFYTQTDRNAVLLRVWDAQLRRDSRVLGVAVNDHFGPGSTEVNLSDKTRDSGKILALMPQLTLASLRQAMERGAILAVRDRGATKDEYPIVSSIGSDDLGLHLEGSGTVRWIGNGAVVSTSADLLLSELPLGTTYVRAELEGPDGSVVYTQAFSIHRLTAAERKARNGSLRLALAHQASAGSRPP